MCVEVAARCIRTYFTAVATAPHVQPREWAAGHQRQANTCKLYGSHSSGRIRSIIYYWNNEICNRWQFKREWWKVHTIWYNAIYYAWRQGVNDPKVFKLGIGMILGYPRKWYGFGVEKLKVKVTGSISAFFTLMTTTPVLMHIWLTTGMRRGFKLYECLLVQISWWIYWTELNWRFIDILAAINNSWIDE